MGLQGGKARYIWAFITVSPKTMKFGESVTKEELTWKFLACEVINAGRSSGREAWHSRYSTLAFGIGWRQRTWHRMELDLRITTYQ